MILAYDTETTGFTQNRLPADHPNQPHLVQLGCMLLMPDTLEEVCSYSVIIKPDGWAIPLQASNVHGIKTEMALAIGIPLLPALAPFLQWLALAMETVAHNHEFDKLILETQIARLEQKTGRKSSSGWPPKMTCTMRESTEFVGIPPTAKMLAAGFTKNKFPSLTELHTKLFGTGFEGAHGALADCQAMVRCLRELRKNGVL